VLYDVEPSTLMPDSESLERALSDEPAAVVFVHHYGLPVDLSSWRPAVGRVGALLIEDAAQAAGAMVDEKPVGAQGDLGILSFGRGKGVTGGGGGAVLATASGPATRAIELLLQQSTGYSMTFVAKLLAQWAFGRPSLYGIPTRIPFLGLGETRYREPQPIRRMSAQVAGVLSVTLGLAAKEEAARRVNARALMDRLTPETRVRIPRATLGTEPGWLRLPFVARGLTGGERLGCVRGYPLPLAGLPEAQDVLTGVNATSGAKELSESLWTVPVHSQVTECELSEIAAWMESHSS